MHMAILFLPFIMEVPDDTLKNLLAKIKISEDDQVDGLGIRSLNELYSSTLTSFQSRVRVSWYYLCVSAKNLTRTSQGGMKSNSLIIEPFQDPIGNPGMERKVFPISITRNKHQHDFDEYEEYVKWFSLPISTNEDLYPLVLQRHCTRDYRKSEINQLVRLYDIWGNFYFVGLNLRTGFRSRHCVMAGIPV